MVCDTEPAIYFQLFYTSSARRVKHKFIYFSARSARATAKLEFWRLVASKYRYLAI